MSMKKIVVTGASGFIGRYLSNELKKQGYIVVDITSNAGDISEIELEYEQVDHVIHLAAKTFVPASWDDPYVYYKTNVIGTENVLEFCRKNVCSLTFLSTYVYGQPLSKVVDEQHPINPNTPYNHSKFLAEELCRFYSSVFSVPITILRPFNIYGLGQKGHFLIPEIIQKCLDKDVKIIEVMDLKPKRDYLHVKDLVRAIICTINQREGFHIYNVGSGDSYSVEDIINIIRDASASNKSFRSLGKTRANEVFELRADITKIKTELDWEPQISLTEGISEMIKDHKEMLT